MSKQEQHHLGEDLGAMAEGGDTLPTVRREELDAHIACCPSCRQAIADTQAVLRGMNMTSLEPSQGFDAALFAQLDAIDEAARSSLWQRLRAWAAPPGILIAGAATAAGLLIVYSLQPTVSPPTMLQPPAEGLAHRDMLNLAEDLELYKSMDLISELDLLEDLQVIAELDVEEG